MDNVQLGLAAAQIVGLAISIFVLLEMRAQRRSAYRPRLALDNKVIWLKTFRDGTPFASDKQEKTDYLYAMHDVDLTVRNIGMGTAHQITVDWQYDLRAWTGYLLPKWHKYIEARGHGNSQYFYTKAGKPPAQKFGFIMKEAREHTLSISNARPDTPIQIRFPETILNAVCFSMLAEVRDAKKHSILQKDFPVLSVRFGYRDIGNRKQTNRINIQLHARCYTDRHPYQLYGFVELAYSTIN